MKDRIETISDEELAGSFDSIEAAIYDLILGKPIIVVDDEDRENEGDLIALADKATPRSPCPLVCNAPRPNWRDIAPKWDCRRVPA